MTAPGLRILHVIPSLSPSRGGPTLALRNMAGALSSRGVTVDVLTTDDDGRGRMRVPLDRPISRDGYTVRYMPRQLHFYTGSLPLAHRLFRDAGRYDLVHIHALFSFPSEVASLAAYCAGVPYVLRPLGTLSPWGLENRRALLKRLSLRLVDGPLLSRAAAVHFTTEQEMEEASALGIAMRGVVVPIGIDTRPLEHGDPSYLVSRYPHLAGRPVALYLSRIDRKKGIELLLDAFAAARRERPAVALVVTGTGDAEYLRELHSRTEELGIGDDVIWTGSLQGEAKSGALASADVFVLPSHSENFGIAVVEAMASGLPVIVSPEVAIARDIAAAHAGLVVPRDQDRLEQAILDALSDPSRAREMGARGHRLAQQRYSLDAMATGLLALYQQITAPPDPKEP